MTGGRLAGVGVLVTRPAHQAGGLIAAIEAEGGVARPFPVIDIEGKAPAEIAAAAANLAAPDIAVFVSSNAVRFGYGAVAGTGAVLAAVGPATRDAIEAAGGVAGIVPTGGFDSEHLLEQLTDVSGRVVWIVRGGRGRELLATTLRERGATVEYLDVYERKPHRPSAREIAAIEDAWRGGGIDLITVMSVESLQSLLEILPGYCRERLPDTPLVTPSRRVIKTASVEAPGVRTILAAGPRPDDIVRALTSTPTREP